MYLLSYKASYLAFKRVQYHFTIQKLHICRPKYFSKLKFWSVLSMQNEIEKGYIKSFPTDDEQNVKSHIFIKFLATQWGHSISRIYHVNMCLHDFKRKLCHLKSWKKQFRKITGDALKMQMRLEKRLRPKTVSYLLIMPTINPPDVCH